MKVWLICEEHGERAYKSEVRGVTDLHCWVRDMGPTPCRVVEMELHPAGTRVVGAEALVVEKDDAAEIVQTALAFIAALERAKETP